MNLSPFCTDVPIRFHAFCNLGAGVVRNRETMKPMRVLVMGSNRLNRLWI